LTVSPQYGVLAGRIIEVLSKLRFVEHNEKYRFIGANLLVLVIYTGLKQQRFTFFQVVNILLPTGL